MNPVAVRSQACPRYISPVSESPGRPGWYERHILPWAIDLACGITPVRRHRERLVPMAEGEVLEVGLGTGLNLPHYDRSRVRRLVGLDPASQMQPLARRRSRRAGLDVEVVAVSAEGIPFSARSFDTVVVTFTLCSIPDAVAALSEMRRVLKPEGRLLFCEHGLAPEEKVRRWQRRLNPAWSRVAGGCHLDRDVPALLSAAGFRTEHMDQAYLPGPRFVAYTYSGSARP